MCGSHRWVKRFWAKRIPISCNNNNCLILNHIYFSEKSGTVLYLQCVVVLAEWNWWVPMIGFREHLSISRSHYSRKKERECFVDSVGVRAKLPGQRPLERRLFCISRHVAEIHAQLLSPLRITWSRNCGFKFWNKYIRQDIVGKFWLCYKSILTDIVNIERLHTTRHRR